VKTTPVGLHLQLDPAVQVQVPEEAVVVVADGHEGRDDQAAHAAGLGRAGEQVVVLPGHPDVLFVQADGVGHLAWLAVPAREDGVEVADLPEAVAAEHQGDDLLSEQVLAGVEVVLPEPGRARVGVGDHHLGHRGPVHDRPVAQGELVQRQPFAGVEPDPEPPPLPGHLVAVEGEARALRLGDVDGLERGPGRADLGRVVEVPRLLRDGQDLLVDQVQHPALDQVDVGDQAVDRMGPRVVLLVLLHEGQHPQHAPALLALDAERPGRQRAGADQVELGDAAAGHGRPPAAVGLDDLVDRDQVLEHDRRLPVDRRVELDRGVDGGAGERRDHVGGGAGAHVEQDRADTPLDRLAGLEGEHLLLRRLLQPEVGEAGLAADQPVLGEHRPGQPDLVRAEPLQGMWHRCGLSPGS
jgi:hypothetical protein